MSLYNKYRPQKLSEVVGQDAAVETLKAFKRNFPQVLLISGPSGTGKTTLARIVANMLKVGPQDFLEMNAADVRGIDGVRAIQERMGLMPMSGPVRFYLLDEAQKLTGDAQSALLKPLEDPPKHVYFALCTTDPQKLLPTIRTRCSPISVCSLSDSDQQRVINKALEGEGKEVSQNVIEKIVDAAGGSARSALVLLEKVIGLDCESKQLEAIDRGDTQKQSIDLCRALIDKKDWTAVSAILKALDGEPETVRRAVLGYARAVILGPNRKAHGQAYLVLSAFESDLFTTGAAGLAKASYEVSFQPG